MDGWFAEEELDDEEKLDDMPLVEGNEEVKEGKRLNILTQSKLLTRPLMLLAQINTRKNSYKFKNELDKYYIFCINTEKPP